MLLHALGESYGTQARGAPNRNDRRPDRETHIRYPRARPSTSNTVTENSRTLRSAPQPAINTPADEQEPSVSATATPGTSE